MSPLAVETERVREGAEERERATSPDPVEETL